VLLPPALGLLGGVKTALSKAFHTDVFVAHDAFGIMSLKRESPLAEFALEIFSGLRARRFEILQRDLSVHHHGDLTTFDDDLLCPPLAVLGERLTDIRDAVKATGADPIFR